MALNANRTAADFSFRNIEQVDRLGENKGGVAATVQALLDSRAEDNLADINNIKTTIRSTTAGDSGAHNIGSTAITGIIGTTVHAQIAGLLSVAQSAQAGTIIDGAITDAKLSNAAGQLKSVVDYTSKVALATGTATAITLTIAGITAYTQLMKVDFYCVADNSGAATTVNINGLGDVALYKPNAGEVSPTLIAGKVYTIYYASPSFFLKASATGDAIAENVLAGKLFSTDVDTDIVGTMPLRNFTQENSSNSIIGSTLYLKPPNGYYDGSENSLVYITDEEFVAPNFLETKNVFGLQGSMTDRSGIYEIMPWQVNAHAPQVKPPKGYYDGDTWKYILDYDLVPTNIKKGVSVFGVEGTYNELIFEVGDTAFASSDAEVNIQTTETYTLKKSITLGAVLSGSVRVSFELRTGDSVNNTAYGRVYVNDVAVGTERSTLSGTYVTYTEDFTVSAGAKIELYIHASYAGAYTYAQNFRIKSTVSLYTVTL